MQRGQRGGPGRQAGPHSGAPEAVDEEGCPGPHEKKLAGGSRRAQPCGDLLGGTKYGQRGTVPENEKGWGRGCLRKPEASRQEGQPGKG